LSFHESETSRTQNIINGGGGELSWEIQTERGWIVCPVEKGETETFMTVEISPNEKEISYSDQDCEGTLTIYSNGGNFNVPVYYNPGITVIETRKDGYYPRAEKLMIPSDNCVEHDFTPQQIADN
jgi:hypothetical protein